MGGTFFRDENKTLTVHNEIVRNWIAKDDQAERAYRFRTANPISSSSELGTPSVSPKDVLVTIDGEIAPVHTVLGEVGEVSLREYTLADPKNLREESFPQPISEDSEVLVSYIAYALDRRIRVGVDKKDYYRITTVAEDPSTGDLYETPLDQCAPFSDREIERVDYMWREGIRRNNWILDQGGKSKVLCS